MEGKFHTALTIPQTVIEVLRGEGHRAWLCSPRAPLAQLEFPPRSPDATAFLLTTCLLLHRAGYKIDYCIRSCPSSCACVVFVVSPVGMSGFRSTTTVWRCATRTPRIRRRTVDPVPRDHAAATATTETRTENPKCPEPLDCETSEILGPHPTPSHAHWIAVPRVRCICIFPDCRSPQVFFDFD
jgi:hypothetical protein